MKLNRRQSLLAGLAGMLTPPPAASPTQISDKYAEKLYGQGTSDYRVAEVMYDEEMKITKRILQEKTTLEDFLYKGVLDKYQQRYLDREFDPTFQDIKSLKSVTIATKERMMSKHIKKKQMEKWRANGFERLKYLLGWKKGDNIYGNSELPDEVNPLKGNFE